MENFHVDVMVYNQLMNRLELADPCIISGAATQLHRGYHTDACTDDRPPDICHLVFVVHGIGQLLHMSNIVKSCTE